MARDSIPLPGIVRAASSRAFWPLPGFHLRILLFQTPSEERSDIAQHLVNAVPFNFEPFNQHGIVAESSNLPAAWCSDMTRLATELAG